MPARAALFDQRGSILAMSLMAAFVATLLAIALFDLGVFQSRLQRDNLCVHRAYRVAEAGLLRAIKEIEGAASGTALNFNVLAAPAGGGTLTSALSTLPGFSSVQLRTDRPDTYTVKARIVQTGPRVIRIVSTGRIPTTCLQEGGSGAVAVVQVDLTRQSTFLAAPLIGIDSIKMQKDGSLADSYNSFSCPAGVLGTAACFSNTSCPQYDAKGAVVKTSRQIGCSADMWTNGTFATKSTFVVADFEGGATLYGNLTAAAGEISVKGGKNTTIWGNAAYDSAEGAIFCDKQPLCIDAANPANSEVQGKVVPGIIPALSYTDAATKTVKTGLPPVAPCSPVSSLAQLNSPSTGMVVYADSAGTTLAPCGPAGPICTYDDGVTCTGSKADPSYCNGAKSSSANAGLLSVKGGNVVVNPGAYCFNSVFIDANAKAPKNCPDCGGTGIVLNEPDNVTPIQWFLNGPINVQGAPFKGKDLSSVPVSSSPWLFQILSSCGNVSTDACAITSKDTKGPAKDTAGTGVEVKVGQKSSGLGLYAYVYAPGAAINVDGDGDLFGLAAGRQLNFNGKGAIHFDKALLDIVTICGAACASGNPLVNFPVDTVSNRKRCIATGSTPPAEC